MKLKEMNREYDAIYSLGHNCLAAMKLRDHNLRAFAGPLDWVGSPDLSKLTNLLSNNFHSFLELKNLRGIQYVSETDILVLDEVNVISFNHDFKSDKNTLEELSDLPQIKEKYDRRIKRFLDKLSSCKSILFIRTEGTFEEVTELQKVLKTMVKNDFQLLVINHTEVKEMLELNWPIESVCALELSNEEIWDGNNQYWKEILENFSIQT
ncbi:DUF1796 family putative cysteine peptidase [Niallia sp. 03133]|uniref:DUF1796 family putative cysteine peptidase n=1 Tax=Niallia sp. 03133 TaxID=3458060 RepID=UPI004044D7E9